jgi:hypothetical protein
MVTQIAAVASAASRSCAAASAAALLRACAPIAARNASRSIASVVTGPVAVIVAVRGTWRSSAISPRTRPAPAGGGTIAIRRYAEQSNTIVH